MPVTNFRPRVLRVIEDSTFDQRGTVMQGTRVQFFVDYDDNGRTFSDGPFSVVVPSGSDAMNQAKVQMQEKARELETLRR